MIRDLELAFIKLHILYHASKGEVFGIGLMEELARHGYTIGPGVLYPTLAKMEKAALLVCEARTVEGKRRKYYRITEEGLSLLEEMKSKIRELYEEVVNDT
ncbi:MAG: PadR family transcriptional regulator [Desulforhabdus sp.]|jgi:DNA-binding PadR family transcriptional regulator|nr:PadR family transcriptional regulator [Desulforhabdus sp.]